MVSCHMKQKKFLMIPGKSSLNSSINLFRQSLEIAGFKMTGLVRAKYLILHWPENIVKGFFSYHALKFVLSLMRLFRKKIVWFVHNRRPHSNKSKYAIKMMQYLEKKSYKMVILSDGTREVLTLQDKIVKVPHPSYLSLYKPKQELDSPIINRPIRFLFIGQIRKYKGIDLLLKAFSSVQDKNIQLLVVGSTKMCEKDYEREILAYASKKIKFDLRFVDDNEFYTIVQNNDILILPYNIKSSLNSGAVIAAFSCKRTVISPLIPTLQEYEDKSFFYSYIYENDEQHIEALKQQIQKVIEDVKIDKNILIKKGETALASVEENNSLEVVAEAFKGII